MSDQITVVGTIVNDPERRRTTSGVTVANFRLATNVRRRDEASNTWVDGQPLASNTLCVGSQRRRARSLGSSSQGGTCGHKRSIRRLGVLGWKRIGPLLLR